MEQSPWKTISHSGSKNFAAFYKTRRFITVFTRCCCWSLYWDSWIQSTPSHL